MLLTAKAPWSVKTDKTERPSLGSSLATLLIVEHKLQFQGELAAIDSSIGPVGFAIAETPCSTGMITIAVLPQPLNAPALDRPA